MVFSTRKRDIYLLEFSSFNQKYNIRLDDGTVYDLKLATRMTTAQLESVNTEKIVRFASP
jgi:cytidylate kinase